MEAGKVTNNKKSKPTYQQYAVLKTGNPEAVNKSLENRMKALIEQMSIYEAEQVAIFRKHEPGGDRIDIEAIFQDDSNVRALVNSPIDIILKNALKDRRFTIVSKTDQKVYITNSGQKYHRVNCPFCKKHKLTEISFAMIENAGYTPCRCIGTTDKVLINKDKMTDEDRLELTKKTMTAFIDESIRVTPLNKIDPSCKDKQASYSYIICKGSLDSEDEIDEKNTLCKNACLSNEAQDANYSAIEAINAVLMKIAFNYNFAGDVVIYTDNMSAVDKWYKKDSNIFMASLFESVKVCHIPREKNKQADAVGRCMIFTNIPTKYVDEMVEKRTQLGIIEKEYKDKLAEQRKEYDELLQELAFVKKYFPYPRYNIPNLIEELRYIAKDKEVTSK